MDNRVLIDERSSLAWTEIAIGSRVTWEVLDQVGAPEEGSNFSHIDALYPYEKVSHHAHAYLKAALEHLVFFADYTAPLKFHPDQATVFTLRPTYTLARAALESAAQSVWLIDVRDVKECLRRHSALIRWDLQEHRKSKIDPSAKAEIEQRETVLLDRVYEVFSSDDIRPPNGYLQVIQQAVNAKSINLSSSDAERLWRAASGVAHGKYWPTLDLQKSYEEERESGGTAVFHIPNTSDMAETLQAAFDVTQYGAMRYADYAGADIAQLRAIASERVFNNLPVREDVDPEKLEEIKKSFSVASSNSMGSEKSPTAE